MMACPVIIDEDSVVSIKDVVEEEKEIQDTANAVLGDSDDTNCTYSKDYVPRQALFACATCNPNPEGAWLDNGGVCLACSLKCHEGHQLYELYSKRNFRCDCGNSKFPSTPCLLLSDKDPVNSSNKYNHNFGGLYCSCNRPYPDEEDDNEVEDDMIQCIVCEDWFHTRHLATPPPDSYEEMVCEACVTALPFLHAHMIHTVTNDTSVNEVEVESKETQSDSHSKPHSNTDTSEAVKGPDSASNDPPILVESGCVLKKRLMATTQESAKPTTGYFLSGWREELCKCASCLNLYTTSKVEFVTDLQDTVASYEERARNVAYIHEAGMDAMGSSMGRVQQVEMMHEYNYMKEELSKFLKGFSEDKKVVRARDIDDFFGELKERKKRRMDTGDGVPPDSCR